MLNSCIKFSHCYILEYLHTLQKSLIQFHGVPGKAIFLGFILGLQEECMKMQYDRYGSESTRNPPVKEGETYKVKIESIGREGDGIAKIEGFVVFVPGAKVGEELDVRINKVTRRVAFGEKVGESKEYRESEEIEKSEEIEEQEDEEKEEIEEEGKEESE